MLPSSVENQASRMIRPNSVPRSAIIQSGGEARVRIVAGDGIVAERRIGFVDWPAESVIVTSGLQPGEEEVAAGVHVLQPGQKVTRFAGAATQ